MTPVGRVVADITLRQGYVKANGATVLRADYPRLVQFADVYSLWTDDPATYPAMYGVGDGKTTMILPDMRGVVERYLDDGKGYDASRVLGTYQQDTFASHTHGNGAKQGVCHVADVGGWSYRDVIIQATGATGGNETRAKNISVLAVIRY